MIKLRLVHIKPQGRDIIITARDEQRNKYRFKITDFYPYFYSKRIPQTDDVVRVEKGYKTLYGDNLYKIYVRHPGLVPKLRSPEDYEADVLYVIRFLIDTGIRDYFYVKEIKPVLSVEEIIPEKSQSDEHEVVV